MAVGILSEDKGIGLAVLYDTVTMTAFGPVMPSAAWAEAFLEGLGATNPRRLDPREVSRRWDEFASAREECSGCAAIAPKGGLCAECSHEGEA